MKISKKVISLLLVLSMTIPLCVGCAKTVKEESENNEQANKVIEEAKSKLKEVEETKESTGIVSDGDGWTLWDEDGHITSGDRDATGKNGVVSAAKYEASQAGLEVLKAGGNAINTFSPSSVLIIIEPPPPIPDAFCSITDNANATATAASIAFPPAFNTSSPA